MSRIKKTGFYIGVIVVSWFLILAIPPLRQMFFAQTIRGSYEFDLGGSILPSVIPRKKPDFIKLAKEHPTNLPLQLQKIEEEQFPQTELDVSQPAVDKQYDELPNQFSHSLLALAYSLNHSFRQMHPIRLAGEVDDFHLLEHKKEGILSPERQGKRNYTQQQWQHVIRLCKEGQRLDPRNAYFDVAEAYWQFAEFHDDAAWAAIQRATTKLVFNLYETNANQSALQAYQIALGRPLYWEEIESYVLVDRNNNLYAPMREMGRWMEWEGIKTQLHGNNGKALKIYDQDIQVMHLWQQTSATIIGRMVAVAIEVVALSGPMNAGVKPDKNIKQHNGSTQVKARLSAFKNYALSIHHPDQLRYAEMAGTDYKDEMASDGIMERAEQPYLAPAFAGFLLWRADVLLLLLLCGTALTWLLTTAFIKVLFRKKIQRSTNINAGEYWRGALSFAALPVSLILIIGYGLSAYLEIINQRSPLLSDDIIGLYFLNDRLMTPWWLIIFGILTPAVFGLGYLLRRAAMKNQKAGTPKVLLWQRILGIIGSLFFVIFWAALAGGQWPFTFGYQPFGGWPFDSQAFTNLFSGFPDFSNSFGANLTSTLLIGVIVTGVIFSLFITARRWINVGDKTSTISGFYSLLHGSALRWLALGSVLYLLMLAIAIPVRRPLQERELKKVTQGETRSF